MKEPYHHFDARNGLVVDCLPSTQKPWICHLNGGHVIVSSALQSAVEARRDHDEWMSSKERMVIHG